MGTGTETWGQWESDTGTGTQGHRDGDTGTPPAQAAAGAGSPRDPGSGGGAAPEFVWIPLRGFPEVPPGLREEPRAGPGAVGTELGAAVGSLPSPGALSKSPNLTPRPAGAWSGTGETLNFPNNCEIPQGKWEERECLRLQHHGSVRPRKVGLNDPKSRDLGPGGSGGTP